LSLSVCFARLGRLLSPLVALFYRGVRSPSSPLPLPAGRTRSNGQRVASTSEDTDGTYVTGYGTNGVGLFGGYFTLYVELAVQPKYSLCVSGCMKHERLSVSPCLFCFVCFLYGYMYVST
jgi:hypothetical protein